MGLPQNSLLPLWGVLAVLEESPRGIHLDHAAALEVVEPALGLVPLREQVVGCHIVADVVEVAAEGAAGLPPPDAPAGPEDHRGSGAMSTIRQNLGGLVDRCQLGGVPRLPFPHRTRGVLRGLDQMVDLDGLRAVAQHPRRLCHGAAVAGDDLRVP